MDATFQKIMKITGKLPVSCQCVTCKKQCVIAPCLGTPQDIEKLIDAGHGSKIKETIWASGMLMGVTHSPVIMYQAEHNTSSGCVFLKDGLCTLHSAGLKPTEGRLSHHAITAAEYDPARNLTWNVAKEWLDENNRDTITRIKSKLSTPIQNQINTPDVKCNP